MRTSIYVDGFNLYYGSLKHTKFKWVNLQALFSSILEDQHEITQIKYFTAKIKKRPSDPFGPDRQMAYINALKTIPALTVHYGQFTRHKVRMEKANPPPNTVSVIKTEEKGSDVNLSVNLLNDAWRDEYDCAVLITNDSDMAEAMRLIRKEFPEKRLGLISPIRAGGRVSSELKKFAHFHRNITEADLSHAQFPDIIHRTGKTSLRKPGNWS